MEKLKMQTTDATEENVRRIVQLFPGCVTEAKNPSGTLCHKIDFDKLRAELCEEQILPEGREHYEFTWLGKRQAAAFAYRPIRATLRPLYAVVRQPKDDATMTNFDELFKTNSPDTKRRIL